MLGVVWMTAFFSQKRGRIEQELRRGKEELELHVQERTVALQDEVNERRRLETVLQSERDLLQVTLASIGEGLLATDTEGRVTFMNPVAERLVGWSARDAFGRHVTEVLTLLSGQQRTIIPNPIERALREGVIVELTDDTLMLKSCWPRGAGRRQCCADSRGITGRAGARGCDGLSRRNNSTSSGNSLSARQRRSGNCEPDKK